MYNRLKYTIKKIFPQSLLYKYEGLFRSILFRFYKGSNYRCNICEKGISRFIYLENDEKLCPSCGSLPRNRRLWELLNTYFLKKDIHILHFSPSRCIYKRLKKHKEIIYTASDFSGALENDKKYDITNINVDDESFELIICYHILEHIDDDFKAMREMYRVLKPNSICLVQTPFKEGGIYENSSVVNENERLKHFGQEDHVRIYSVDGLKSRLEECGFSVDVKKLVEEEENIFGYNTEESIMICKKAI